jgi:hypothetical protein
MPRLAPVTMTVLRPVSIAWTLGHMKIRFQSSTGWKGDFLANAEQYGW